MSFLCSNFVQRCNNYVSLCDLCACWNVEGLVQVAKRIDGVATTVRALFSYILAVDEAVGHRALGDKRRPASIHLVLTLYLLLFFETVSINYWSTLMVL